MVSDWPKTQKKPPRTNQILAVLTTILKKMAMVSANNDFSTHPSMETSEENKLPPSFSGFKSQKFLHESSYDGFSGTDNDEQSLNNSASVFHLWLLEAFSWFQFTRSYLFQIALEIMWLPIQIVLIQHSEPSKHAWAFSKIVQKISKITHTASRFSLLTITKFAVNIKELRFNIIKNLLYLFFI